MQASICALGLVYVCFGKAATPGLVNLTGTGFQPFPSFLNGFGMITWDIISRGVSLPKFQPATVMVKCSVSRRNFANTMRAAVYINKIFPVGR